jgi:hypothetical protein
LYHPKTHLVLITTQPTQNSGNDPYLDLATFGIRSLLFYTGKQSNFPSYYGTGFTLFNRTIPALLHLLQADKSTYRKSQTDDNCSSNSWCYFNYSICRHHFNVINQKPSRWSEWNLQ